MTVANRENVFRNYLNKSRNIATVRAIFKSEHPRRFLVNDADDIQKTRVTRRRRNSKSSAL
jgi:hypothetical protein